MFERVRKAAFVAQPGCFVGRTIEGGEVAWINNSAINLILDKLSRFAVEKGPQERLDAVEVEVIRDEIRAEPR